MAHKVRNVNPADVTVRLGDWNPQKNDDKVSDLKKKLINLKVACLFKP